MSAMSMDYPGRKFIDEVPGLHNKIIQIWSHSFAFNQINFQDFIVINGRMDIFEFRIHFLIVRLLAAKDTSIESYYN